jgi:serine/threonine protein kinase
MAEIYRARRWTLHGDEDVAIKRLLPMYNADEEFIVMLTDEARITRLFDHPNIARVLEFGVYEDQYFLVMEFIDGRDLRSVLRRINQRAGGMGVKNSLYVLEQALRGLHAAHEQRDEDGRRLDVIHRDFTPSNILLGFDGAVKLIDFGIAKARLSRSRTRAGFIKGKIKYMSPEQTRSEVLDCRSDVFAAGVVLYRCITGRLPFEAHDDDALIEAVREAAPTPPSFLCPKVDSRFDALIHRAMAKDPDDRFETAEAFADAVGEWGRVRGLQGMSSNLGAELAGMFAADRVDAARLQESFVTDDDPTPTIDRQSYTRLVGIDDPYPRTLTGFESASEGVRVDTGTSELRASSGEESRGLVVHEGSDPDDS